MTRKGRLIISEVARLERARRKAIRNIWLGLGWLTSGAILVVAVFVAGRP